MTDVIEKWQTTVDGREKKLDVIFVSVLVHEEMSTFHLCMCVCVSVHAGEKWLNLLKGDRQVFMFTLTE